MTPRWSPPRIAAAALLVAWCLCVAEWNWLNAPWPALSMLRWLVFAAGAAASSAVALRMLRSPRPAAVAVAAAATAAYVALWTLALFASHTQAWDVLVAGLATYGLWGLFLIGLGWAIWYVEGRAQRIERARRERLASEHRHLPPDAEIPDQGSWNFFDPDAWFYGRVWNPLSRRAWYYDLIRSAEHPHARQRTARSRRLDQSLAAFLAYAMLFALAVMLFNTRGCYETYEMPAGGGEAKPLAQVVKLQKVIRQKFVVNPYSAIKFEVPPIDEVRLQLEEITEHAYKVGYGEGAGAGFGPGAKRGKVRLIRLEYSGGDWNLNHGVGGDLNMLVQYGAQTNQPIADRTESRAVAQLANFPPGKAPPLVYLCGQQSVSLSNNEVKALREYLIDGHGMLFGDAGSPQFHGQFMAIMQRVLPDVQPVPVPLDDVIHRVPNPLPFFPYASPHGGRTALGWKQDGRWLVYYHPGDIGDAWADGHAGVQPHVYKACYQLGTNVMFYAHTEYAKWLESRNLTQE